MELIGLVLLLHSGIDHTRDYKHMLLFLGGNGFSLSAVLGQSEQMRIKLTHKAPITTAADDILIFFFLSLLFFRDNNA